jgi:tripartite-type tricarboxylate transporter receptor subunit TctC
VGVGSSPFLATELFRKQAGFDGVHVPYNSSPQALTDLAGGRIEFMFVNMPTAVGFIKGNRIRPIGIASPTRSTLLPDVQEQIRNLGGEARWSTPAEFRQFLDAEISRWAPVAREAGVKLDR